MDVQGNLNLNQNQIQNAAFELLTSFPLTPVNGELAFVVNKLYMYIEFASSNVWIPMSVEVDSILHSESVAALSWVVDTSSFSNNDIVINIYDENDKKIIPDDIDTNTADQVTVTFSVAQAGKAILMHRIDLYDVFQNSHSFEFNGTNQQFNFGSDASLAITDNLSVSFWTKGTDIDTDADYFQRINAFNISNHTGGEVKLSVTGGGSALNASTSITDGNWHHVVITFSGGDGIIYVDGSSDGTNTFSVSVLATGTTNRINQAAFRAMFLDEMSVWDTAVLTAGDVTSLYNSGVPTDPSAASVSATLVSWWRMGDTGSGDTVTSIVDQVGSNTGTGVGGANPVISTDVPT